MSENTDEHYKELMDSIRKSDSKSSGDVGCGVTTFLSLILFAIGFALNIYFAFVLWIYYVWFIEPVTAFKIPFYCVLGFAMIIWLIQGRMLVAQSGNNKNENTTEQNLANGFAMAIAQIILFTLAWGFGWLYFIMFV